MQNGHLIEEGSVLDIFSNPKEPLTQEFIKTATGIDEALVKIEKQALVQHLPKRRFACSIEIHKIINRRAYRMIDQSAVPDNSEYPLWKY